MFFYCSFCKWIIDSAATADYNIGLPPNHRTMSTLEKNGIKDYSHAARLVSTENVMNSMAFFGLVI